MQAASGIKVLLKDPASAKDKIDELMVQCKDILDGGMNLTEAMEQLRALLEAIGIDPLTAKLGALQPALERVWALVGVSPQAPMLKRVQMSLQALAKAPLEQAETKFAAVRTDIKSLASSIAEGDFVAAVQSVFNLLSTFEIPLPEAMQTVLTAMLARVLKALDINDSLILGMCHRAVGRTVAGQLGPAMSEEPVANAGLGKLTRSEAGTLQPLMDALAEAVLSLGAAAGTGHAPPFSLDQALKLLEVLGVNAQDALLPVVSGAFLRKALEAVGVPATHGFQKEARGVVLQLAHCPEEERNRKVAGLKLVLVEAAASVWSGSNPIDPLVAALVELGIPAKSMATVMAPLLAQAVLQAAGIPKGHAVVLRVERAARAVVIHARTLDEACEMVGVRAAPAAGSVAAAATGAAGAVSDDSDPQTAAQAVMVKLGIPMAALHAGLQAAAAAAKELTKERQRPARRFSSHFEETHLATTAKAAGTSTRGQYKVAPEHEQKQEEQEQEQEQQPPATQAGVKQLDPPRSVPQTRTQTTLL